MFYYQMGKKWGLENWWWNMMPPSLLLEAGVMDIFISALQNRNSFP